MHTSRLNSIGVTCAWGGREVTVLWSCLRCLALLVITGAVRTAINETPPPDKPAVVARRVGLRKWPKVAAEAALSGVNAAALQCVEPCFGDFNQLVD